jgi:signal transduction histidine kinase
MAPASLFRSTVFRRSVATVLLLATVASAVIALIGWHANAILTRATTAAIEADIAELRAAHRARSLQGLAEAVTERSRPGGLALYRLEDDTGHVRAGNLAAMPAGFDGGARAGTFRYRPAGPAAATERTAAGVLIEIDNQAQLVVARDIEEQRALLFAIYRSVALGALLLCAIGLASGVVLARYILARVDAMGVASARIMEGDLSGRIPLDGSDDELDRLARRLNEMLARIEQLMAGLREVSDNIAHDLRTPLNRLRNRAEAALADGDGAPAWHRGLERVIDEADEVIKTFNALLLIARLEAVTAPEPCDPVDVGGIVRDLVELYEPVAEDAGITLRARVAGELPVRVNRQLVGQALTNLIDNALKYGRPPPDRRSDASDLLVTAERMGNTARIIVADRGPGIPAGDRERALRRFVRLDQSRSEPGTGLGLSLVAAVARLHGGTVQLEDNHPGLRVVLSLPLASPDPSVAPSPPVASKETSAA